MGDVGSVVEFLVVVACVEVDVVGVVKVDQFSVVVGGLVAMGTLLVIAHTAQHSTLIS